MFIDHMFYLSGGLLDNVDSSHVLSIWWTVLPCPTFTYYIYLVDCYTMSIAHMFNLSGGLFDHVRRSHVLSFWWIVHMFFLSGGLL